MSESVNPIEKYHFLFRRLHSLSGIIPVGVFSIFHLFANAQMLLPDKGKTFQHEVEFIHSMPGLLFIEITLWSSIGFHALLGFYYMLKQKSKMNNTQYEYTDNTRYTLQRITGYLAFIFIFLHVATLRWRWDFFGWYTPFMAHDDRGNDMAMASTAYALQYHTLVVVLYTIGALSVVYHWANGLWTAAITWGVTITVGAQKKWGYFCVLLGITLTFFTVSGIIGALNYDLSEMEKFRIDPKANPLVAAEEDCGCDGKEEVSHDHDGDALPDHGSGSHEASQEDKSQAPTASESQALTASESVHEEAKSGEEEQSTKDDETQTDQSKQSVSSASESENKD